MKKILITSAVAAVLLAGVPAYAHDGKNKSNDGIRIGSLSGLFDGNSKHDRNQSNKRNGNDENKNKDKSDSRSISGIVTAVNGTTLTVAGTNGITYTAQVAEAKFKGSHNGTVMLSDVRVGDRVKIKGVLNGTTMTATSVHDKNALWRMWSEKMRNVTFGVVTSVNGSTFVIDPIGASTTGTVTTNGATLYKQGGKAATSAALTVGSPVLVVGTTTLDSGSNSLIAASVVHIWNKGIGFLKHLVR